MQAAWFINSIEKIKIIIIILKHTQFYYNTSKTLADIKKEKKNDSHITRNLLNRKFIQ